MKTPVPDRCRARRGGAIFAMVAGAVVVLAVAAAARAQVANPVVAAVPGIDLAFGLETVESGMTAPNWGESAPGGDPGVLYVVDQPGLLWHVDVDTGAKRVFLDLRARLLAINASDERGFLGLAFHPAYAQNGLLYTYISEPVRGAADFSTMPIGTPANHQSVIHEWRVDEPADPDAVVNASSAREVLRIDQPQSNHNGGGMDFGPDGTLYIGLGDGGGGDDQGIGHGVTGNGQNLGTVLGAILRIDPVGRLAPNGRYSVPVNNPFVPPGAANLGGAAGCRDGFCDEIFAYGFRNPYRLSFDRVTGSLVAADVGQHALEEVNVVRWGGNYGWNLKEGTYCFNPNGDGAGYVTACFPGPAGLVNPAVQYDHDEGTAIIGGFVYRGPHSARLQGCYLFGDYARTYNRDGRIFVAPRAGRMFELRFNGRSGIGVFLLGFAEDGEGNVYILGNSTGGASGTTGVILRPQVPLF